MIIDPFLFADVKRDRRSMMKSERNMVTAFSFYSATRKLNICFSRLE